MSDDAPDRAAILARRRRFVTAALAGLATTSSATACPCLKVAAPDPEPTTSSTPASDDAKASSDESKAAPQNADSKAPSDEKTDAKATPPAAPER